MSSFYASPKQRGVIFAAYNKYADLATPSERAVLERAYKYVYANGRIYYSEIQLALEICNRASKTKKQTVSGYTNSNGTFVKSYVRRVKKSGVK